MHLIFLDTETTGLNPEKHRIIDFAYKVIDSMTGKVELSYQSIVAQTAEVWAEADPESLAFNGFTWEDIIKGKTEKYVASEIENDLNHLMLTRKEAVFICQNPSFDRCFFNQLINPDIQAHFRWPYHWLDLASMYWAIRQPEATKSFKESDLSKDEIARYYNLPKESMPHRAMNGVDHLIACYEALFGSFAKTSI